MKPWLLPTALIALGTVLAIGAGWGANLALGAAIALGEGESLDKVAAPAKAAEPPKGGTQPPAALANARPPKRTWPSPREYVDAIVKRNLFDHTKVGLDVEEDEPCEGEDCEGGERSSLPATLVATMLAEPIELSAALIFLENEKRSYGYGIGDKLLDATIIAIHQDRVIVERSDGAREYISAGEVERPADSSGGGAPTSDGGVSQEGDNKYVVPRELFDKSIQDMDALAKMARARPHKDGSGEVDGFRLSGVRRNELLYQLGVRSGDIIHGVNGQPLTSMSEAMAAYSQLQSSSSFSFEVTRRGQRMTMEYDIR